MTTEKHNCTIVWRPGGARCADWPWSDGDEALVAVQLYHGNWELYHIRAHCDEEGGSLTDCDDNAWEPWAWEDIEWWAKLNEVTFPE